MLLEAKNLAKEYGDVNKTNALKNVSMNIEEGDFIGIMGPSGSGKSTLVNILSGIIKPTLGTVKINEQIISNMNKNDLAIFRRRTMGFVFQDFNLLDNLTIMENVMLPMILDKKSDSEMNSRALELLEYFGISKNKDKFPYEVSGGEMQRSAIARALVNNPKIVFADEPTGNLDSKSSSSVMELLEKMNQEKKTTVLMVTHDPFAASFCKKVIFIKDGNIFMDIVKKGTRKEFFDYILDCQAIIGGKKNDIQ